MAGAQPQPHRRMALRRASPYHMAFVTLLSSLGQGLPLASMFKVYNLIVCRLQNRYISYEAQPSLLPAAPELPPEPNCDTPWVQQGTSAYSAAIATVGALTALLLLDRANRLTQRFGRKVLLLIAILILAAGYSAFELSVSLPAVLAAILLFVAVLTVEASQGTLLRVATQAYVVDTTEDESRAGKLSFIEGFGQIGAFPSSALGGWLAAVTGSFNAPFYACSLTFVVAWLYVLILVPESKKRHQSTIIDDLTISGGRSDAGNDGTSMTTADETAAESSSQSSMRRSWLSFLRPLKLFLPMRARHSADESRAGRWTLFNIAVIIFLEECYQVFLIPLILMFNADILNFDVLRNGYLISILQGSRALVLTVALPLLLSALRKLRDWIYVRRSDAEERRPLLQESEHDASSSATPSSGSPPGAGSSADPGHLELSLLLLSYVLSAAGFATLAMSRRTNPLVAQVAGIITIELGSGATSLRLALLTEAVPKDQQADIIAASQMISTCVFAILPLLSSLIYSSGLAAGFPEAVWLFKAGFAALAAVSTLPL